jgi:regulator of protease activity HflC (stomatin/prohibitin superfamily)
MFGIRFIKADPHVFILHYQKGKIRRRGPGLSFYYYAPTSSLAAVPVNTVDIPFAFPLVTKDFQTITLQGQLSYRVTDPERLAGLLNFTFSPGHGYLSDDPSKLSERLLNLAQTVTHGLVLPLTLPQTLVSADVLGSGMLSKIRASEVLSLHGVEVLTLSILSVKPTPDMAKALEAETREQLQQKSDQATYARRNAAVEQERKIKESELSTELAVEAKHREIREMQMATEVTLEEQRTKLMEQKVGNERKEIENRLYELTKSLAAVKELDWRTVLAMRGQGVETPWMMADAIQALAAKVEKIGTVNLTPDLVQSLLQINETRKD